MQIGEEARYLVEMMMNLQQIYGADTGDLYTVFCPQKGLWSIVSLKDVMGVYSGVLLITTAASRSVGISNSV